ncbi:hypothetical protein SAMN05880582_1011347 [Rhizobium sp. RU20A]|uniref:HugZ family pyridoxamine 5'-phosphate oxidase n=1 Tax=Rhizobium sp. RU20A TaxID=1907412 RepID=UPI000955EB3E|nr:DUF2470 domain-containing protein [Rhizobium sp. RU20A]SIQ27879.1 hypothetical protein SAMN05880582_1011347 [Rhizobium sp. RU20A]
MTNPEPADRPSVLRDTDDEARKLARLLLQEARSVALATVEPATTGFPFVSRVLMGLDCDGRPTLLVSGLSAHTRALDADPRCSLLAGDPGKGDPLAYPRLTLQCRAVPVARDSDDHVRIRARFLRRHPKAKLYADFPDFRFFRLEPERASLNGGFGRAYVLDGGDFLYDSPAIVALSALEAEAIDHMNTDHRETIAAYARLYLQDETQDWQIVGIDITGIDLASGDQLRHINFEEPVRDVTTLRNAFKYLRTEEKKPPKN